ncbi:MAG TPA: sodium-transporting two-sector ATPase [Candidatus Saccharimonadales bacterium]|nr:sodium-transporting two-sector ATPase [Candidatus Saccharimonadales bacterium]
MFDNPKFQKLVEADNLTGEVVATNSFIVEVKGLEGVRLGAQVLFEDGQRGLVREAYGDRVILFNIDSERIEPGTLAVVENDTLSVPVGKNLVGRVISPLGEARDGKGAVAATKMAGIFNQAPGIMDRSVLNEQLVSGVTAVDMFFPVVLGQRIAILGDSKAGKSTFLSQLSANQEGTNRIVIYVLIGKRKVDVERLLSNLRESGAMKHTIVVMADIFDSLTQSYLAPYAACAMAEELWYGGEDVIVIYDDLSSHAEAYRQLSLLQEVDPGRDSFPGDIFYAHSSLLERAGKLLTNMKTLTALPVVMTPNDDITGYLSTSIMSITDGQIVFDLGLFREGIRPAVNAGLSVSRVGGQAQTHRQKGVTSTLFQKLAKYTQAEEFSHFGSSLSKDATIDLRLGKQIYSILQQPPSELHSLVDQELMLETVLLGGGQVDINTAGLKEAVKKVTPKPKDEKDFDRIEADLLKKFTVQPAGAAAPATQAPGQPPAPGQPSDNKDNKIDVKTEDKDKDNKKEESKESDKSKAPEQKTEEKPEQPPAPQQKPEENQAEVAPAEAGAEAKPSEPETQAPIQTEPRSDQSTQQGSEPKSEPSAEQKTEAAEPKPDEAVSESKPEAAQTLSTEPPKPEETPQPKPKRPLIKASVRHRKKKIQSEPPKKSRIKPHAQLKRKKEKSRAR